MRVRFLFVFIAVLALAACSSIPMLDALGQPVLDPETNEPVMENKLDADKLAEGAGAVGMLLPPPWNLVAPIIGSLVVALKKKG